ncbi:hypothetical protein A3F00_04800 [Candidatus Daviesbacteria bacterium RIFCSPHIGHO2_12_FULL_37_11]|uniref:CMP/dCMP-type deaminase domain-containing protein n=1 Tax=Candidatus Daviesbacteria bacterium RIFCSPHIGHO2_12_FULL_37_11 TaxID=1797777 RepID=A0A1F5KB59_9BACT|nr:MAG: hypothetical protein A2111_02015 [Candidatus Daviesbacteria bacterium GWA1_38_6]OGE15863.1 MAG: hypothetical protein A2769_01695 [Candidatus Daviesbacteria bacterium RIFCSPHIGHO2_01_FULL_37_27]OGE38088.1 MAG: hypothetical protein A3F00_04800 [Candidatus Daviesbacteria bacterium RIFCSPHIGHO2_12_FULL_37_11]OGE44942.1 MAG: hypothetical protein A3B39_02490 [Candidatus Daviesbacteria bacterium RIFCSPLOWO2_01_FULL_37_10]
MISNERYTPLTDFMEMAIAEAQGARADGDYAVGSVIIKNDKLVIASGNRTRRNQLATAHAEKIVIERASKLLGYRHLTDCVVYTTHEPCPMCAGAISMAQIPFVVVGARLEDMKEYAIKNGNHNWRWRTIDIPASYVFKRSIPSPTLIPDFMREECLKLFHS